MSKVEVGDATAAAHAGPDGAREATDDAGDRRKAAPGRSGRRDRAIAYALLAAAIAVLSLLQWPGLFEPDSIASLEQSRTGWISDQRSAIDTWLWRQAWLAFGAGPGFLLLAQILAVVLGLYLTLRAACRRIPAAALAFALPLTPPFLGWVYVIGRDMEFVAPCLLAMGLAVGALRWRPAFAWPAIAAGVALAILATTARQNGVTAVWPIMIALSAAGVRLLAIHFGPVRALARRRTLAIAVGSVLTVCALGVMLVGTSAVRRVNEYPEVYTQLWDLGYMTIERDERMIPVLPPNMQPAQSIAEVRERWQPSDSLYMRFNRELTQGSDIYSEEAARTLRSAWLDAIKEHPLLYLRGRLHSWRHQLGIGFTPPYTHVSTPPANRWNYRPALPGISQAAIDYAGWWEVGRGPTNGIVYHVWIYLLFSVAGLVLLLPRFPAATRMIGLFAAAGVANQVGLFILSPAAHWRYQLLTVYTGTVVVCVAAAMLWRAWRTSPESASSLVPAQSRS